MKRYRGDGLPANCNIAVVANDAIGNFVVATPLLQLLRSELQPAAIDYYGGKRTKELQDASTLLDWSHASHGSLLQEVSEASVQRRAGIGDYDLVVNLEGGEFAQAVAGAVSGPDTRVCGACLNGTGAPFPFTEDARDRLWQDPDWTSENLTGRFDFLETGFIADIFSRLAYLKGDLPAYTLPTQDPDSELPDIVVSGAASLPEKLWPAEKWQVVLERLRESGKSVGLVGAKPQAQKDYWKGGDLEDQWVSLGLVQDLRGMYTLPQVCGLLGKVCGVLTIDNGILHLAAAAGTQTVGLFRYGIHRLWAPPVDSLKVLKPASGAAVETIEVEEVWEAVSGF